MSIKAAASLLIAASVVAACANIGAAAGSVSGSVDAQDDRKEIVIQCMRGRGHKVVG